ncbi:MAG: HIT family protein [Gammaproteobacteria bacterium]|nr:HIT family protein [Gammaproteobacteria bacterium]MBU1415951.1 HIT family protein [Gammaproteobacteria bacterium]
MQNCPLCSSSGGDVVWEDSRCRVVRVGQAEGEAFPGYCRVVWQAHVAEMTDLDPNGRRHFMNVVFAVEAALRSLVAPDKINLAELGNQVPHLHWHVIPRWRDDSHFPAAIWASPKKSAVATRHAPTNVALSAAIAATLSEAEGGA